MTVKRTPLLLSFLIISLFPAAQQIIFKNYSVQDGLGSNPVRVIYQDRKGFLWIGGWEGLSKYDGYKFTNFTTDNGLSHNMVNDLYEDENGWIYVALNNGNIDVIKGNRASNVPQRKKVIINRFLRTKNGEVFAGTDNYGIVLFRNGQPVDLPPQRLVSIASLTEINDSLLLVGGPNVAPYVINKSASPIAEFPIDANISTVYNENQGESWVGTYNDGLKRIASYRMGNNGIDTAPLPEKFRIPALTSGFVGEMLKDAMGNYWFCKTNGLLKIDARGKARFFTMKDGLPSNLVRCIYMDNEHNIWVGTQNGLSKIVSKNNILRFTADDGVESEEVFQILPDSNDLYMATQRVTRRFDMHTQAFTLVSRDNNFFRFLKRGNELLGIVNDTLYTLDIATRKRTTLATTEGIIFSMIRAANGSIFLGTTTGLLIYNKGHVHAVPSLSHRIHAMTLDNDGQLWVGTWENGLYVVTPSYGEDTIRCVVQQVSLPGDPRVRSIFKDRDGDIWIGRRYDGLTRLHRKANGEYDRLAFTNKHGLMSNWVSALAQDQKGSIWAGTYIGVNKLVPVAGGFRVFNFSRINNFFGIVHDIFPDSRNNMIWCGTYPGLVGFRDDQTDTLPPPPIYITSIQAGKPEDSLSSYDIQQQLLLKYDQNKVMFEFSSPSFINEKEMMYSYRLLGTNDTNWSQPSNNHSVLYASLQQGTYTFETRVLGWNGRWSAPATYSFTIRPPFWKTAWFIIFCAILFAALVYAVYRYRISQLLKLQRVRNRIATDLHDDIGSSLTNISILSELSDKNIRHDPIQAQTFVQRISEEVHSSSQALDDIVWSINSRNDSLEQIVARMRRYASEIFDASNINYSLQMEQQFASRKLNMEQRRDLFLIFKETINNIYKHAEAKNVVMKLWVEKNRLHLSITDDGRGFEPGSITHRNGLKNIRHRTQKWKGNITITSAPGQGTRTEIDMVAGAT